MNENNINNQTESNEQPINNQVENTTPPVNQSNNSNKSAIKLIIIIIVIVGFLLLVGAIGLGFYLYSNIENIDLKSEPNTTEKINHTSDNEIINETIKNFENLDSYEIHMIMNVTAEQDGTSMITSIDANIKNDLKKGLSYTEMKMSFLGMEFETVSYLESKNGMHTSYTQNEDGSWIKDDEDTGLDMTNLAKILDTDDYTLTKDGNKDILKINVTEDQMENIFGNDMDEMADDLDGLTVPLIITIENGYITNYDMSYEVEGSTIELKMELFNYNEDMNIVIPQEALNAPFED